MGIPRKAVDVFFILGYNTLKEEVGEAINIYGKTRTVNEVLAISKNSRAIGIAASRNHRNLPHFCEIDKVSTSTMQEPLF
jgi:hypothetical protein